MQNVTITTKGKAIVITIPDATLDFGPSSTGKNLKVASSGGNQTVALPDGTQVKVGVNAYKAL